MRRPSISYGTVEYVYGKRYYISLGENKYTYTNKREALRKSYELTEYLTEKVNSINSLLGEVYIFYRRLYFTIDVQDSILILRSIRNVEDAIEKTLTKGGYNNGCYYVFSALKRAIEELKDITTHLLSIATKRHITTDVWSLKSHLKVILLIEADIQDFNTKYLPKVYSSNIVPLKKVM